MTGDRFDAWMNQAEENTDKWGVQPPADVVLAIMEELAEVTEEILYTSEIPSGQRDMDEPVLMSYIVEIAVLGTEIREELENQYEDENGRPIPEHERPTVLGRINDPKAVDRELDDLGPLVVQLAESIDEYSKE
jgi:NTP pyrophosphatase (non-canonical NTP hydrolase)